MHSQFLHLGSYGRAPRKGTERWACIAGVTQEGSRLPHASRHIPFPAEPRVLHGILPVEAGRIAAERADQAYDATGRRRLRRDGIALLAGIASYPTERRHVNDDPVDQDAYSLWLQKTLDWLRAQFGEHLLSVVEHCDERHYHLHFYVVPSLDERKRLNVDRLHPGRYAKVVALAEGASKKNAERSYRKGMREWQNAFHRDVSAFFRHDRYGPRRARVSRREREMEQRMEAERERMLDDLAQKAAEAENDARRRGLERYARPYENLQTVLAAETARREKFERAYAAETLRRRQAESELLDLRARLAALEEGPALSR